VLEGVERAVHEIELLAGEVEVAHVGLD